MSIRLSKIAKELNVGADTVAEYLAKKGHQIPSDLNHLLTDEQEQILRDGLSANKKIKQDSERITQQRQIKEKKESVSIEGYEDKEEIKTVHETHTPKIIGKIDLDNFSSKRNPSAKKQETDTTSEPVEAPQKTAAAPEEVVNSANVGIEKFAEKKEGSTPQPAEPQKSDEKQEEEVFSLAKPAQTSINVVGKIDLSSINQQTRPKKKTKEEKKKEREQRGNKPFSNTQNNSGTRETNETAATEEARRGKRQRIQKERIDISDYKDFKGDDRQRSNNGASNNNNGNNNYNKKNFKKSFVKPEVDEASS